MFIVLAGRRSGPSFHARYFQLKGWNKAQKEAHVGEFKAAYTSFGIAATLLEMVPFAGIGFAFSNAVGAALWASDMESGKVTAHGTSPDLKRQAMKAE